VADIGVGVGIGVAQFTMGRDPVVSSASCTWRASTCSANDASASAFFPRSYPVAAREAASKASSRS